MPKQAEVPTTIRALRIIDAGQPEVELTPRGFAELVWPPTDARWRDSWRRASPAGPHGSTHGGGMWRLGGSFLGKLKRAGLVTERMKSYAGSGGVRYFRLTDAGRARLAEWDKAK